MPQILERRSSKHNEGSTANKRLKGGRRVVAGYQTLDTNNKNKINLDAGTSHVVLVTTEAFRECFHGRRAVEGEEYSDIF